MSGFKETRWTLLGAASEGDRSSQDELARLYLPPVVRYLRRAGAGQEAEDLGQEVFLRVFRGDVIQRADPRRGRFRSLLLAVAQNVWRGHRTQGAALKRGGGVAPLSLEEDLVSVDEREAFDREWVLNLLERAIERLAQEHPSYHEAMKLLLQGEAAGEIAARLGRKPQDVSNLLHRARKSLARYLQEDAWGYAADPEAHATELALLVSYLPASARAEGT